MAQDYSEWLAVNVLNEQQNVNYRNLSRALKVHCNLAKQMLYEFHHKQNSKKPGTVHATYLITGTKRDVQTNGVHSQEDGEDTVMRSSPPLPSSSIPQPDETTATITVRSIMLVKEEHLDRAKDLFENITSIHIYSLQANSLNDFQPLTDCNRRVAAEYASEDPLKEWKQYGVIQNPHVKRRTRKTGPPPAAVPPPKPEPAKAKAAAAAAAKSSTAEIKETARPSSKGSGAHSQPEGTSKPATLKKEASSIFKSFAKGAAKPKKRDSQQSSAAASPALAAEPDDVPMTGFSDDDDDDQAGSGLPDEEVKAPTGKSRKEREAELQAMMDQEDEPMEDAATPAADEEKHDEGAIDKVESQPKDEPKDTVTVENGRRRGRRRVMKKKTVKDEDGYLVTREEAAWESFSEEERAPKKPKVQAPSATKPSAGKKAGKPGQGNIMSFFSKK